jgi:hypothetical protein
LTYRQGVPGRHWREALQRCDNVQRSSKRQPKTSTKKVNQRRQAKKVNKRIEIRKEQHAA